MTALQRMWQNDLEWFLAPAMGGHSKGNSDRYPLTNLGFDADDNLYVEVACAGFRKENIGIECKNNLLHITGKTDDNQDNQDEQDGLVEPDIRWTRRHISPYPFERIVVLQQNYVGGEMTAELTDGILRIKVQPKEAARRTIEIG